MRTILIACALILCASGPALAESAHPTPADPNHVHGDHADSGIGSGGHDNGVVGVAVAPAPATPPADMSVLPVAKVPLASLTLAGEWTWTLGTPNSNVVRREHPSNRLRYAPAAQMSAVVFVLAPRAAGEPAAATGVAGHVRINTATQSYSGWMPGTVLVVPVAKGTDVTEINLDCDDTAAGYGAIPIKAYLWP